MTFLNQKDLTEISKYQSKDTVGLKLKKKTFFDSFCKIIEVLNPARLIFLGLLKRELFFATNG